MKEPLRAAFERDHLVDKPGIVGARWWQRSLVDAVKSSSRRDVLTKLLVAGGALGAVGLLLSSNDDESYVSGTRGALAMQKEFGWSFGADTEHLTFDGESTQPFDRPALTRLPDELRPTRTALLPFYVPTLFESPSAHPGAVPAGETVGPLPLWDVLRPIFTPAMASAYLGGKGLASLFSPGAGGVALVVDLDGPESVAFAAGTGAAFDPVFGFDNWPHPRGVVPAHLTLGAAAYFQPLFARRRADPAALPMFVLDRQRLHAYTDDSAHFDNRYVARLPPVAALRALGVKRVLCVVPTTADTSESDDLNDDFVAYAAAGIEVKLIALSSFAPGPPAATPEDDPPHLYGGRAAAHSAFWADYGWAEPPPTPGAPLLDAPGRRFVPTPRVTAFSSGVVGGSASKPRPHNFGTVSVVLAGAHGALLGASMSRSGTWNRASGGSGA
jgi:hypothetical protein